MAGLSIFRFFCFDDPAMAFFYARIQNRVYELACSCKVEINFERDIPPGTVTLENEFSVMDITGGLDQLAWILNTLRQDGYNTKGYIHTTAVLGYEGKEWLEPDVPGRKPRRSYFGFEDLAEVATKLANLPEGMLKVRAEREFYATPDRLQEIPCSKS